jgi:hypothetical protein
MLKKPAYMTSYAFLNPSVSDDSKENIFKKILIVDAWIQAEECFNDIRHNKETFVQTWKHNPFSALLVLTTFLSELPIRFCWPNNKEEECFGQDGIVVCNKITIELNDEYQQIIYYVDYDKPLIEQITQNYQPLLDCCNNFLPIAFGPRVLCLINNEQERNLKIIWSENPNPKGQKIKALTNLKTKINVYLQHSSYNDTAHVSKYLRSIVSKIDDIVKQIAIQENDVNAIVEDLKKASSIAKLCDNKHYVEDIQKDLLENFMKELPNA